MRRTYRWSSLVVTLAAPWLLVGCGEPEVAPTEGVNQTHAPIIGGSADTTHQAVVEVALPGGSCSGTIIHANGTAGYVLTAAHCCDGGGPDLINLGNNYLNPDVAYSVTDYQQHPAYNSQTLIYDFCMVQFYKGADTVPTIGVMTPAEDNLDDGSAIELVGYGITPASNSIRKHIGLTIDFMGSIDFGYDISNGGTCSGDSGGPALANGAAAVVVAGVTSAVSNSQCDGYGISGRVSSVNNGSTSFIQSYLTGTPMTTLTCDECLNVSTSPGGACDNAVDACFNNSQCAGLADCLYECPSGDQTCVNSCANTFSSGINLYNAIFTCVCDTGCLSECGSEDFCQPPTTTASSSVATTGTLPFTSSNTGTTSSSSASGTGGAPVTSSSVTSTGADTGQGGGSDLNPVNNPDASGSCAVSTSETSGAGWIVGLGVAVAALRRRRRS
jgi:MYXO-CTERM domain-containing protein